MPKAPEEDIWVPLLTEVCELPGVGARTELRFSVLACSLSMTHFSSPNYIFLRCSFFLQCANTMTLTRFPEQCPSHSRVLMEPASIRRKISGRSSEQEYTPRKSLWFSFSFPGIALHLVRSNKHCTVQDMVITGKGEALSRTRVRTRDSIKKYPFKFNKFK